MKGQSTQGVHSLRARTRNWRDRAHARPSDPWTAPGPPARRNPARRNRAGISAAPAWHRRNSRRRARLRIRRPSGLRAAGRVIRKPLSTKNRRTPIWPQNEDPPVGEEMGVHHHRHGDGSQRVQLACRAQPSIEAAPERTKAFAQKPPDPCQSFKNPNANADVLSPRLPPNFQAASGAMRLQADISPRL